jgi:hypothetical protein
MISLVITAGITFVLVVATGQSVEDVVSLLPLCIFFIVALFKTSKMFEILKELD